MNPFVRLSLVVISLVALVFSTSARESAYSDGIVAIVNEEVITLYDIAVLTEDEEKRIRANFSAAGVDSKAARDKMADAITKVRVQAAHQLIEDKVIYSEFLDKGYQIPAELVEKRIDRMVAKNAGGSWVRFEDMLAANGRSLQEFRERIERRIAVDMMVNQEVDRRVEVSPYQIEEFYREHKDDFYQPAEIRMQMIMVKKAAKAIEVLDKLAEGAKFSDLAARYSRHPSKKNGGDLGWLKLPDMRAEFRDGFEEIGPKATSKPVLIGADTYLIHIADYKSPVAVDSTQAREQIRHRLFQEERAERYRKFVQALRDKSYVRVFFKE